MNLYLFKVKNGFLLTKSNILSPAPFLLFLLITGIYSLTSTTDVALNFAIYSYFLYCWETLPTFIDWMMPDSQISILGSYVSGNSEPFAPCIRLTIWMLHELSKLDSFLSPFHLHTPNSSFQRRTLKISDLSFILIFISCLIINQSSNSVNISIKMSKLHPFILIQTLTAFCQN